MNEFYNILILNGLLIIGKKIKAAINAGNNPYLGHLAGMMAILLLDQK